MVTMWTTSFLVILGKEKSEGNYKDEARCQIPLGVSLDDPSYQIQYQKDNLQG